MAALIFFSFWLLSFFSLLAGIMGFLITLLLLLLLFCALLFFFPRWLFILCQAQKNRSSHLDRLLDRLLLKNTPIYFTSFWLDIPILSIRQGFQRQWIFIFNQTFLLRATEEEILFHLKEEKKKLQKRFAVIQSLNDFCHLFFYEKIIKPILKEEKDLRLSECLFFFFLYPFCKLKKPF
jgi:hypothetical protein